VATIQRLMRQLNYPTEEAGVCRGIAVMAERARQCGEYSKFKERMTYLNKVQNPVKFQNDVAAAKLRNIEYQRYLKQLEEEKLRGNTRNKKNTSWKQLLAPV
jgi:hypothetical protein